MRRTMIVGQAYPWTMPYFWTYQTSSKFLRDVDFGTQSGPSLLHPWGRGRGPPRGSARGLKGMGVFARKTEHGCLSGAVAASAVVIVVAAAVTAAALIFPMSFPPIPSPVASGREACLGSRLRLPTSRWSCIRSIHGPFRGTGSSRAGVDRIAPLVWNKRSSHRGRRSLPFSCGVSGWERTGRSCGTSPWTEGLAPRGRYSRS